MNKARALSVYDRRDFSGKTSRAAYQTSPPTRALEKAKQEALLKLNREGFALQDECNALFKKTRPWGVNLERAMQQTAKHGPTVLQRNP
jgi:hypothetical protein